MVDQLQRSMLFRYFYFVPTVILWFLFTLQTCKGDGKVFLKTWLGAAKHLVDRFWEPEEATESEDSTEMESEESESVGPRWEVDQLLEAKWTDGEYYYGHPTKIYQNGNYAFAFDDGHYLKSVAQNHIRERTPIVPFGEKDISEESEEEEDEDENIDGPEIEAEDVESRKYNKDALTLFLMQESKHYEYFLNGTTTSYGESFHSICNLYYPKGSTVAFKTYKMKKTFAALHWQELRENGTRSF